MAEFKQAVKWMAEGKKVRRSCWDKDARYYKLLAFGTDETIKGINTNNEEYQAYFDIDDFGADDWEIYYKETLSNKYLDYEEVYKIKEHGFFYKEVAIKKSLEGLKQLIDKYLDSTANKLNMLEDVRKIFGDRLI